MSNYSNIKRAIVLSFLLLANTIILAHGIIPHHDHEGVPYILLIAKQHDDNRADNHAEDAKSCILSNVFTRLNNNREIFPLQNIDFNMLPCILTLYTDSFTPKINGKNCFTFIQKSYILSFIARSSGLRAPPNYFRYLLRDIDGY